MDSPPRPPLLFGGSVFGSNARIATTDEGTESPTLFVAVRRNRRVSPGRTRILVGFGFARVCGAASCRASAGVCANAAAGLGLPTTHFVSVPMYTVNSLPSSLAATRA